MMQTVPYLAAQTSAQQTQAASAGERERAAQVDALMARWNRTDAPGAAVMIIRDGRIVLNKGYGMANLERQQPITPTTGFDLASVSKQFTAMAIMILAERRRLSLDDNLARFFPNFPPYARSITVRHLLNHTSGLADYPNLLIESGRINRNWQIGWQAGNYTPTSRDILELLAREQQPRFAPGERWEYSNSNYVVLAQIVERVSGMSFARFLKENVFQPLGMSNTIVFDEMRPAVANHATRYDRSGSGYMVINSTPFDLIYGDGNVRTTTEDLYKWDQALYGERLVSVSALRQAFTSGRLRNGAETGYGFGWNVGQYFGLNTLSHEGGGTGFNSFIMRVPEHRFTVVVLSNFARFNPYAIGRRIARIYLGDRMTLPAAVRVAPEILQRYAGRYQLTPLIVVEIRLEDGLLRAQTIGQERLTLLAQSENTFFVEGEEDRTITFDRDESGNVLSATVRQDGGTRVARRLEPEVQR